MRRYFIGLMIVIILLILLIILIVNSGGSNVPSGMQPLPSYANTNATARLIINGPIVSSQNHNVVEIIVSNTTATLEVQQGYSGNIIKSKTYNNSINSYSNFLYALEHANFTAGNPAKSLQNYRGYCPTGDTYVFELRQNGHNIEQYWATNCSGTPHTFGGHLNLNITLFQQQIPDYSNLINNVNI